MADLGNAWHIPGNPEPPGRAGMCDPVGGIFAGTAVTIVSGNQFRGAGNPGVSVHPYDRAMQRARGAVRLRQA